MNAGTDAALLAAGVLAGIIGTAGGITSLVSFPALLAAGVPVLTANVVNIVALVACWPGSALVSRPELEGRRAWLLRWGPVPAVGGAAGAALLLSTPAGLFAWVVPFLVMAGSAALLLQPRIAGRRVQSTGLQPGVALPLGLGAVSIYNGYFGAGSGVMVLALMLLTVDGNMARANALKNMLIGASNLVSAVLLVVFGSVDWAAVVPLAAGLFLGSTLGPLVARRLPSGVMRWSVALMGVGLAIELLANRQP